jgi:hypothetical protein
LAPRGRGGPIPTDVARDCQVTRTARSSACPPKCVQQIAHAHSPFFVQSYFLIENAKQPPPPPPHPFLCERGAFSTVAQFRKFNHSGGACDSRSKGLLSEKLDQPHHQRAPPPVLHGRSRARRLHFRRRKSRWRQGQGPASTTRAEPDLRSA